MAICGTKRLGYIDGRVKDPPTDGPRYGDWEAENRLAMNKILNYMEDKLQLDFAIIELPRSYGSWSL